MNNRPIQRFYWGLLSLTVAAVATVLIATNPAERVLPGPVTLHGIATTRSADRDRELVVVPNPTVLLNPELTESLDSPFDDELDTSPGGDQADSFDSVESDDVDDGDT